jgi:hypothetical protein
MKIIISFPLIEIEFRLPDTKYYYLKKKIREIKFQFVLPRYQSDSEQNQFRMGLFPVNNDMAREMNASDMLGLGVGDPKAEASTDEGDW